MNRSTRRRKGFVIAGVVVAMLLVSYTYVFARQIRCHFIAWSDLKAVTPYLYVDPRMSKEEIAHIEGMLAEARRRDSIFLGGFSSAPVIIAGHDEEVIERYGSSGNRTAMTHVYFGEASIVLGPDGLDTSVIAHEMMHAELSERVGWLRREMEIPVWFDEGLAMQVDHREEYSEEEWLKETDGGRHAPALNTLSTRAPFASDDYWLSYTTSKHEVMRWHGIAGREGLNQLLNRVRDGETFEEVYRDIERDHAARRMRDSSR